MKKSIFIILLLCFCLHLTNSQQWVDKKYEYDSLLNVTYGSAINFNGDLESLQMDIYFPECDDVTHSSKRPLLIWIHGGSFLAGDKNDVSIQALCKDFAKRGYVTASIDYRLGFISDELKWECNYPNYNCVFATDSIEWARAYYRAVQDGKGALRYLINRHLEFRIDTDNVFLAGESAGSFTALGVGLMDMGSERPAQTFSQVDASLPNPNTYDCVYNKGISFNGNSIARPDLGGINGDIEPTNINYTIKGIGNMYGAMMRDLLKDIPANKHKPAIYSFHQPCDIIVSIDSNYVDWGLSWCFTNGYNCYGITNNEIMLYGSRVFSKWNTMNNYGYDIKNEFTNINFPYQFIFGDGSCLDQVNKPCHAYDNKALREKNLAVFFSDKISTNPICDTTTISSLSERELGQIKVYPNPTNNTLHISGSQLNALKEVRLYGILGKQLFSIEEVSQDELTIDMTVFSTGLYILYLKDKSNRVVTRKVVKE